MKNKLILLFFLITIMPILKGGALVTIFYKTNSTADEIPVQKDQNIKLSKEHIELEKSNIQEVAEQNNSDQNKNSIKLENSGIRPEDMSSIGKSFKLFEISCDKKQLMYYGAEAVVLITICGVVAYVFYKNGTFKKIGDYIGEHKFEVRAAIGTACVLAIVGIYAIRNNHAKYY